MVNRVPLKVGSRPPWFGALEAYKARFRSQNRICGDAQAVSAKPEETRNMPIAYFLRRATRYVRNRPFLLELTVRNKVLAFLKIGYDYYDLGGRVDESHR